MEADWGPADSSSLSSSPLESSKSASWLQTLTFRRSPVGGRGRGLGLGEPYYIAIGLIAVVVAAAAATGALGARGAGAAFGVPAEFTDARYDRHSGWLWPRWPQNEHITAIYGWGTGIATRLYGLVTKTGVSAV